MTDAPAVELPEGRPLGVGIVGLSAARGWGANAFGARLELASHTGRTAAVEIPEASWAGLPGGLQRTSPPASVALHGQLDTIETAATGIAAQP